MPPLPSASSAEKHSGAPRDTWPPNLLYTPLRTCVGDTRASATSRRGHGRGAAARASLPGGYLSARGVAWSRGRRPRRSSHPPRLPQRREPRCGGRCCWTVHASTSRRRRNVPPRARLPHPLLLLLLLALSPVDSALTARAHICMRVPVSCPSLSLYGRTPYLPRPLLLRRFSRSYQRQVYPSSALRAAHLTTHAADARARYFPLLLFSPPSAYNNERCGGRRIDDGDDDDEDCDNDYGNDGRRARARALSAQGPCLSSARAVMCPLCVCVRALLD